MTGWIDSATVAMSIPLKDLKDQVGDRLPWRKSIYIGAKNQE